VGLLFVFQNALFLRHPLFGDPFSRFFIPFSSFLNYRITCLPLFPYIQPFIGLSMVYRLCFLLLLFPLTHLDAQTDSEFWFVAPEVSETHGDSPIFLRISTLDQDADVKVRMPADPTFQPISVMVPAGTTQSIDLSSRKNKIENWPPNMVLRKGLFITSTVPVRAYYEVANQWNPEIFPLKGINALGNRFFIPSQNSFPNIYGSAAFDIVATEDQTTLEITPSNFVVGQTIGIPFTVVLDRGETFSVRASGTGAGDHLGGSKVVSDKPVAVTYSDDSILNDGGGGYDLAGDQLVPVNLLGTEYIAIKGPADTERVYITATEDNTQIFLAGSTVPDATIQTSETAVFDITGVALHILASKPVYVLHLSGQEAEVGDALLPPVRCTGSLEVGFIRTSASWFGVFLLTRNGNQDAFVMNNNAFLITAGDFQPVPGTNNDWVAALIQFNTFEAPTGNNRIRNDKGFFHLGVINRLGGSAEYGYFSDYSSLNLGVDRDICEGGVQLLDAGPGKDQYLWNTGDTSSILVASQPGIYWVTAWVDDCVFSDTVELGLKSPQFSLGPDTFLCPGSSIQLQAGSGNDYNYWSNGQTGEDITVSDTGLFWVEVGIEGCPLRDSIQVDEVQIPLELGPDAPLCDGDSVLLDLSHISNATFNWIDGSGNPGFWVTDYGTFWVEVSYLGCQFRDSISFFAPVTKVDLGPDTVLCPEKNILLDATTAGMTYVWNDQSHSPTLLVEKAGTYHVLITDGCGSSRDTVKVDFKPECDCTLYFANAFTPNGDGHNDWFRPVLDCEIMSFEWTIFDRWGREVFHSQSIDNGWDGTKAGEPLPEGVYVFLARYSGMNNDVLISANASGSITLLR
jgi:gliding motility-associated-like protein